MSTFDLGPIGWPMSMDTPTTSPMAAQSVPGPTAPTTSYGWLQDIGVGLGLWGATNTIIGTSYALRAQQGSLRMEAQNAEFAANQANIAGRRAEEDADAIIRAGAHEAGIRGMQSALDVASFRANAAASGVEVGAGNAGEGERAIRLAAELDKRTLRTNAERRASATREQGANVRAGGVLGLASATNMRRTASSINPTLGAIGAGAGAAGSVLNQALAWGRR